MTWIDWLMWGILGLVFLAISIPVARAVIEAQEGYRKSRYKYLMIRSLRKWHEDLADRHRSGRISGKDFLRQSDWIVQKAREVSND